LISSKLEDFRAFRESDLSYSYLGAKNLLGIQLKKYHEALTAYQQAISLQPEYYQVGNNRRAALEVLKDRKKALESYTKALCFELHYQKVLDNRFRILKLLQTRSRDTIKKH
jgi:tetratricopeptide (TPR) repeat protein